MRPVTKGSLLLATSGLSFGSLTVLVKLAYVEGVGVAPLLAIRFGVATLALLPIALLLSGSARGLVPALGLGAVGYTLTTTLYFHALRTLPAGTASFLLYTSPLLVVVLARVLLDEHLTRAGSLGLGLGLAGLLALAFGPAVALNGTGVLLALGSAVAYAGTILVGRRIVEDASPWTVAVGVTGGASVAWMGTALVTGDLAFPTTSAGWAAALLIALLCTTVAMATFFLGLPLTGAPRAAILSMLEPVASVALAAVVLDERLSGLQLLGCLAVLAGVVLAARPSP